MRKNGRRGLSDRRQRNIAQWSCSATIKRGTRTRAFIMMTADENNQCVFLLACVSGLVNQELFLENEYFAAENRILQAHLPATLPLSDAQRSTLAEIGKRLTVLCGAAW